MEVAARAAVEKAVPAAVAIALADYQAREGWKVGAWRAAALAGLLGALGSIIADKPGILPGISIGLAIGGAWFLTERLPPRTTAKASTKYSRN